MLEIILMSVAAAVLVAGALRKDVNPFVTLIFIGMVMIFTTTTAGEYLVGSDVHMEYYFTLLRHGGNVDPQMYFIPQGTSVVSYLLWNMDSYRILLPSLFALVPVASYIIFCRWVTPKRAFLGAFLAITFAPFFLELPTVPRQMAAELALMGMYLLVLFPRTSKKLQVGLLILTGIAIPLFHYSIAIVSVILLVPGILVKRVQAWKWLTVGLVAVVVTSCIYFPIAQDAAVARKVCHLYNQWAPEALQVTNPDYLLIAPDSATPPPTPDYPQEDNPPEGYGTLIRTALGVTLQDAHPLLIIFLVYAWVFVGLAAAGLWQLRRNTEFWSFGLGAILLVALCAVPGFAGVLNITRIAHLALLTLAVLPFVKLPLKVLTPLALGFFFLSSGVAFEVAKIPNIATITVPYNYALSGDRIDLGVDITPEDYIVRDYVIDNELYPIYADAYSAGIFTERMGPMGPQVDKLVQIPKTPRQIEGYVFVRSRNTRDGALTSWADIGCRKQHSFEEWQLDFEHDIVFQYGNSYVLRAPTFEEAK
jgi:hypothetical protein